jgi:hypothetical protein
MAFIVLLCVVVKLRGVGEPAFIIVEKSLLLSFIGLILIN